MGYLSMRPNYLSIVLTAVLVAYSCCSCGSTSAIEIQHDDNGLRGTNTHATEANDDKLNVVDEERVMDFAKLKAVTQSTSNLEKFKPLSKSMSNLDRQKYFSKMKLKLSRTKHRSVTETELTRMKKFADSDPDLRKISSLVGKNPTKLTKSQLMSAESFVKKHPRRGIDVLSWLIGVTALAIMVTMIVVTN